MKKTLFVAAALITVALAITGCNKKNSKIKIGAIQLVEHPALDNSYKGFVDGLAEEGFKDGENIIIDYQNAQGEQANCVTIANKFVNDKDDLIFAIATPAAQAVANLTKTIPILVTAVTDPATAKLVKTNRVPGTNVSGTSDRTPVDAQISLLKKLVPEAKTIGIMYCSSEANSVIQVEWAKESCKIYELDVIEGSVSNSNEIQQVAQSLVGKVDALYIPTDNMLAAGMANVAMVANEAKLPVICGEEGMVATGGLATYGINYYGLGKRTGHQAARLLRGEEKISEMPIEYLEEFDFTYNKETAEKIGITIPEGL
jgi:putative ABC transport system substrate-binding protein